MAGDLTRKTTGLTPAHIGLLKLLAAIAVDEYVQEIEPTLATETSHEPEDRRCA